MPKYNAIEYYYHVIPVQAGIQDLPRSGGSQTAQTLVGAQYIVPDIEKPAFIPPEYLLYIYGTDANSRRGELHSPELSGNPSADWQEIVKTAGVLTYKTVGLVDSITKLIYTQGTHRRAVGHPAILFYEFYIKFHLELN
jgi:hypothetical protein